MGAPWQSESIFVKVFILLISLYSECGNFTDALNMFQTRQTGRRAGSKTVMVFLKYFVLGKLHLERGFISKWGSRVESKFVIMFP